MNQQPEDISFNIGKLGILLQTFYLQLSDMNNNRAALVVIATLHLCHKRSGFHVGPAKVVLSTVALL